MTTEKEHKWEDIDALEQLKLGDELEYICAGVNKEFKYWGKVIDIQRSVGLITVVRMEGDWSLVQSSLTAEGHKLTRKVEVFVWPAYVGACVEETYNDTVNHYVRVGAYQPNEWVRADSGEFSATWELELICAKSALRVLGRGY